MTETARSYSTSEVAKRLGVSTQTVQRWVDSGQLKAWKTVGGHRRIEAEGAEILFRLHAHTLSVLIVDDNPDDRDILTQLVEDALPSATIATADNGFHGLVAIGRTAPDVVITDLVMPHMNGFEMLRQLQSGCAVRPRLMIAVSSLSLQDLAPQDTLPSGVAFMQKPLDPDEFTPWLQQLIQAMPTPA